MLWYWTAFVDKNYPWNLFKIQKVLRIRKSNKSLQSIQMKCVWLYIAMNFKFVLPWLNIIHTNYNMAKKMKKLSLICEEE